MVKAGSVKKTSIPFSIFGEVEVVSSGIWMVEQPTMKIVKIVKKVFLMIPGFLLD